MSEATERGHGRWLAAAGACLLMAACTSTPAERTAPAPAATHPYPLAGALPLPAAELAPASDREQQYGIRYHSLRLSGSGLLLDLRYRVLDADKAAQVVNRKVRPVVIDAQTGNQFQVPHAQKIGTLRHMGGSLKPGRVYSMLFANPGRTLKSGSTVNLVMGDYRLDGLTVE